MRPTTLSTALWRPTSSATTSSRPADVNKPAACSPPVSSKTSCAGRSLSGRLPSVDAAIVHDARIGGVSVRSDSIVRLPHSPHEEFPMTCRRSARRRSSAAADPFASVTLTTFSGCSPAGSVQCAIVPRSSAEATTRSESRKPAARSQSAPGVRMITANGWPCRRISSGSSVAARSSSARRRPSRTRVTPTDRNVSATPLILQPVSVFPVRLPVTQPAARERIRRDPSAAGHSCWIFAGRNVCRADLIRSATSRPPPVRSASRQSCKRSLLPMTLLSRQDSSTVTCVAGRGPIFELIRSVAPWRARWR